ncbi:MAG: DoxX family protein [Pyrinomonadaceae bacterium]|nr:DoxX family protein [Pyrinomonadaceae bacterium]MCX7638877.1 DoxX family protein [Pyrinomonadaceae bacterium]MDW8304987.1 DoxX family protein [Acidobacteriota bacterium]
MLRKILIGGEDSISVIGNLGLTLLRVFTGIGLISHGYTKLPPKEQFVQLVESIGFPAPSFFAWAAGLSETVGGALLILGFLTRPASFFVAVTMITALIGVHLNDPFSKQELAFLYLFIALCFLLLGSNSWSVDGFLRRKENL